MAYEKYKLTHDQGVTFLTALIALIYNFVKSFRKNKNDTE